MENVAELKLLKMEAELAGLAKQVNFLTQKLDEARRATGLSRIIDVQILAINANRGNAA